MTLTPGCLQGKIAAIPSKSDLHRIAIASSLAGQDCGAVPEISEDIGATKAALQAIFSEKMTTVDCKESGSTLRFLLPVAAALAKSCTFTGTGRLPARPLQPLLGLLRAHGCAIDAERLPLQIGGRLLPGRFALPGNISSQFVTGLLFALPLLPDGSEIALTSPLESRGYVDMTLRTLACFSIVIEKTPQGFFVPGGQCYLPPASALLAPEGDWSNAAFWLAANALGSDVTVANLDRESAQPDRVVERLFAQSGDLVLDAAACPDLVPIAAVVMALTPGVHTIQNAARLRLKESDRLAAMAQNLNTLGAEATELPDGLRIRGSNHLRGGVVESHNDHRIAMAMAIAALRCDGPVLLRGAQAVAKSYPGFWEDYNRLKGNA
ncbi:MAG: 3-phosphoshikimate 1-carboxyvinyltransferase [Oscillospiraceae bacterium]|jgi:3-phosphoshikimate 1-carboxyvinyltransferase|nr:3-phosphoshikimate 1-carboxyvinyltransferase [Oscillospiraceae bacterium]